MVPSHASTLIVRWLHLVGVSLALGGAALAWAASRRAVVAGDADSLRRSLDVAESYEWLFWTALGAVVAAGVGNLGAFGDSIPGVETAWGTTLAWKLALVSAFLVGSAARGVYVSLAAAATRPSRTVARRLRASYAVTAVVLLVLVGFGEVLAHG
jgi:uncharacterized membrane protein